MWSSVRRLTGSHGAAQPLGLVGLMVQLHIWARWALRCSSASAHALKKAKITQNLNVSPGALSQVLFDGDG